ncbi:MAG: hypothetical protein GY795_23400 [Desulfobacterales bacterium]|nr:hypothetical protein [Desulfobacterales bacterium]
MSAGKKIVKADVYMKTRALDRSRCAVLCFSDQETCKGFNYDESTKTCELAHNTNVETSGSFIKQWTNFVIVLAMYNSVLIPL